MRLLGHLDANVVTSCNARCTSCSHAAPVNAHYEMPPEELERDLAALKPFVRFHKIQMVGGEPTLHKNLPEMMRVARASGVGREIMVITNGRLLRRMTDEFWKEMDMISVSIYPGLDPEILDYAKEKCAQFNKPFYSTVFTDFHIQLRKEPNDGSHFASCFWKGDCFSVHRGYFHLCPQSIFFPKSILNLPEHIDGLPLADLTEEKLEAFLTRKEPLESCKICMANEMKTKPWSESKRSEWITESTLS